MRPLLVSLLILLCICPPVLASPDGSIEIFLVDPESGAVEIGVSQGHTSLIYPQVRALDISIQARLAGRSMANFAAAEFYLQGLEALPSEWLVSVTVPYEFTTVGSLYRPYTEVENGPLVRRFDAVPSTWGTTGSGCMNTELVELARVRLLTFSRGGTPADLPSNWLLRIVAGDPPSIPFLCPLIVQCDTPVFTPLCVDGGQFVINPREGTPTAVAHSTWSVVKKLYR